MALDLPDFPWDSLATAKAKAQEHPDGIELRPMSKFPVVRDLVVDRRRLFRSLERVKAWVPVDDSYDHGPGPRISPEEQAEAYPLSECMSCGCCLEACPQYTRIDVTRRDGESDEQFAARRSASSGSSSRAAPTSLPTQPV